MAHRPLICLLSLQMVTMITSVPQTIQTFPDTLHNNWRRQGRHPWLHVTEDKLSPKVFSSHLRLRSKPKAKEGRGPLHLLPKARALQTLSDISQAGDFTAEVNVRIVILGYVAWGRASGSPGWFQSISQTQRHQWGSLWSV